MLDRPVVLPGEDPGKVRVKVSVRRASYGLSMLSPQDLSKAACPSSTFVDTAWPALQKRPPLYRTMLHDDSNRRWACPDTWCMQSPSCCWLASAWHTCAALQ